MENKEILCDELIEILEGSFGISINLSDFFFFSSADSIQIDIKDLIWVLPVYKKYGWDGIYAAASYIAKITPLEIHINKKFSEAYSEIINLSPKIYSEY